MKAKVKQVDFDVLTQKRIDDAEALYSSARYDGAIYLCGYALEYSLKSQICVHNEWSEFTPLREERTFTTHELDELLKLSGKENAVQSRVNREWIYVKDRWNPTNRYLVSSPTRTDCRAFIDRTKIVVSEIRK